MARHVRSRAQVRKVASSAPSDAIRVESSSVMLAGRGRGRTNPKAPFHNHNLTLLTLRSLSRSHSETDIQQSRFPHARSITTALGPSNAADWLREMPSRSRRNKLAHRRSILHTASRVASRIRGDRMAETWAFPLKREGLLLSFRRPPDPEATALSARGQSELPGSVPSEGAAPIRRRRCAVSAPRDGSGCLRASVPIGAPLRRLSLVFAPLLFAPYRGAS